MARSEVFRLGVVHANAQALVEVPSDPASSRPIRVR